ncbi:helix-turn-helix domain-containing protein [Pandoraea sp. PE-S2R-1]|uniref:helix-turn-helix domain-containing protein n=1 Tax=Pandoraea sp. PE-S2R-1 TaxID=1986994 RepID=UPI000B3F7BC2|nr:helix-turn-helix transcriptional regulator [Pandoraea sp. PE-S2R-1]
MTPNQQLEFLQAASNEEIAKFLAMRVRGERSRSGRSQAAFAEKAGISLRTYKRFELSGTGSIDTLVRIMMALDHARGFFTLFPHPKPASAPSLIERLKMNGANLATGIRE